MSTHGQSWREMDRKHKVEFEKKAGKLRGHKMEELAEKRLSLEARIASSSKT